MITKTAYFNVHEFRRSIKLPADVDPKSLRSVIMENGKLRLVALRKRRPNTDVEENKPRAGYSAEIEIKTTKQNAKEIEKQNMDAISASEENDGDIGSEQGDIAVRNPFDIAPLADINVEGFETEDLKVRVVGNDVFIHGEQNSVEEDGMQVRRRFLRSFTLPSRVDASTVKSTLTEDGRLVIKAAPPAIEQATTSGDEDGKQVADNDAEQDVPAAADDVENLKVGEQINSKKPDGGGEEETMVVAKEDA